MHLVAGQVEFSCDGVKQLIQDLIIMQGGCGRGVLVAAALRSDPRVRIRRSTRHQSAGKDQARVLMPLGPAAILRLNLGSFFF